MVIELRDDLFANKNQIKSTTDGVDNSITLSAKRFEGRIAKHLPGHYLLSFVSTSNALNCALEIQSVFNKIKVKDQFSGSELKIGLSCGVPVTNKENIFEETIDAAERLCDISQGKIIVSPEVKELFESENQNAFIDKRLAVFLSPSKENFLKNLMDFTQNNWEKSELKVNDFSKSLGLSKSKFYRNLKSTTGKSPNTFIKDYRLNKALSFLNKQKGNVAEIAYEIGFNSPAYFSKCFHEKYGILPSAYTKK